MRAQRTAFVTEIPAPFRIPLFNALAARDDVDPLFLFLADHDPRRSYRVYAEEFRFATATLPGLSFHRGGRWLVVNRGTFRALARFRPDVIVIGGWNQPAFWQSMAYARLHRTPIVVWVESTARDDRPGHAALEAAKSAVVRQATAFLVPGRASAAYVESLGVEADRIAIAPNAVDLEIFGERVAQARRKRTRLRAELGMDRCTFLYVGRLDPEKGLEVLLRAMEDVAGELVVVGSGGLEARLRQQAPASVRFVGQVARDDLVPWYAAADAFVLPSLSEPWGMVVNEAAAAGLPIVATEAVGAAWDLVEDGVNGFRVAAGDARALAAALGRLAADPDLRRRAGRQSESIAAGCTPHAWAEGVAALVRRLAQP